MSRTHTAPAAEKEGRRLALEYRRHQEEQELIFMWFYSAHHLLCQCDQSSFMIMPLQYLHIDHKLSNNVTLISSDTVLPQHEEAFRSWTNEWAYTSGEGGGDKATAGQSETKGGRQRGGGQTGKSCWPCISAWWHLAGPIWALNVKVATLRAQGVAG